MISYVHTALSNACSRGPFQWKVYVNKCKHTFWASTLIILTVTRSYANFYNYFLSLCTKRVAIKHTLKVKPGWPITGSDLVVICGWCPFYFSIYPKSVFKNPHLAGFLTRITCLEVSSGCAIHLYHSYFPMDRLCFCQQKDCMIS